MNVLTEKNRFDSIREAGEALFAASRQLPENGFSESLPYIRFLTLDDFFSEEMFLSLKKIVVSTAAEPGTFAVYALDPDPIDYFYEHYGFYGGFEFSLEDSADCFVDALGGFPEENIADAVMHNGNVVLIVSSDSRWLIMFDRDTELTICAFDSQELAECFTQSYPDCLSLADAAGMAYGEDESENKQTFLASFSE